MTEINNAIAPAVGQLGGLDVLIVNAGTSHIPDFQETADEAYDALMGVNPKGECFSMFHVLPTLKECRRIVLVGSVAGRKGSSPCREQGTDSRRTLAVQDCAAEEYDQQCDLPPLLRTKRFKQALAVVKAKQEQKQTVKIMTNSEKSGYKKRPQATDETDYGVDHEISSLSDESCGWYLRHFNDA